MAQSTQKTMAELVNWKVNKEGWVEGTVKDSTVIDLKNGDRISRLSYRFQHFTTPFEHFILLDKHGVIFLLKESERRKS